MQKLLLAFSFIILFSACSSSQKVNSGEKKISDSEVTVNEEDEVKFGRLYIDATKEKILGNNEKAAELYKKALTVNPYSAAANYELGLVYDVMGETDLAFLQFRMASEQEPENYWYKIAYATFLQSQGKIDESIVVFKNLVKSNPNKTELKYELSKLLLSKNKGKESIKYLNEIEKTIGITEEISFLKKRIYLSENDIEAAAQEVQHLIDSNPGELKYYGVLADVYLSNEKRDKALSIYKKMQDLAPENYMVQFSLAEFYRTEGNEKKYLENITKAMANPAMNIDDKINYILTFYQVNSKNSKKKKEGIELCKLITDAHPKNAKAHAIYADFLYFDGQSELAKKAYEETIALDSSRFPVWNQLLVIQSETNDIEGLIDYGSRAVDLFPNQPTVYLLYALGLAQDNQHDKAIDYLQLGKDLVVDNQAIKSQIFSSIGDSYHSLKKHQLSDRNYDKALELDPNNVYVLNNYSYYLSLRKEKLEKAKEMSEKSNNLAPNQASFQDTYAWVLYQLEEYDEALKWIEKAISSSASVSGTLLEHKGDILFQMGKKEEAIEYWEKAKAAGGASDLVEKKISDRELYE